MSVSDIVFRPRIDLQTTDNLGISILVVSEEQFYKKLRDALMSHNQSKGLGYKLVVHFCQNAQDILELGPSVQVDLIVFIIDPRARNCLQQVEGNLETLDPSFLFGRTCLIKVDLGNNQFGMSSNEVWGLCKKYGLHLLVDSIMDPAKCSRLAERVSNLAEAACGLKSGLPPYIGNGGAKWNSEDIADSVSIEDSVSGADD